jgi:hypothetical protein
VGQLAIFMGGMAAGAWLASRFSACLSASSSAGFLPDIAVTKIGSG